VATTESNGQGDGFEPIFEALEMMLSRSGTTETGVKAF